MLELVTTKKYRKDLKLIVKQGKDITMLEDVIRKLKNMIVLDAKHHDHPLHGDYIGHRECHIEPDWLLIYRIDEEELILTASRTGSHSELF